MKEILVIKYNRPLENLPSTSMDVKKRHSAGTIIDNKWLVTREQPVTSLVVNLRYLDIISSPKEIVHPFFTLMKIEDGRYYYRVHIIKVDMDLFEELIERIRKLESKNKQLLEVVNELQQDIMWWEDNNEREHENRV